MVESSRELAWIRSRLLDSLMAGPDTAVICTNLQGLVAYWNDGAEALYGWAEREALGRDILDLTPTEFTRDQSAEIMTTLQAGRPWSGEIDLRHRDGSLVSAFVIDVPIGDFASAQGAIVGISVVADRRGALEGEAPAYVSKLTDRFTAI